MVRKSVADSFSSKSRSRLESCSQLELESLQITTDLVVYKQYSWSRVLNVIVCFDPTNDSDDLLSRLASRNIYIPTGLIRGIILKN